MGVYSRLAPCYLPTCTEKNIFVPLPTLENVSTRRPRPSVSLELKFI